MVGVLNTIDNMMPSYAALHIVRSNHGWTGPQLSRVHTCRRQIRCMSRLNSVICQIKSANIFVLTGWGQSAKFNSRQIFRLYGMTFVEYSQLPTSLISKCTYSELIVVPNSRPLCVIWWTRHHYTDECHLLILNKYKNNLIKLKDEVGMAVPKCTQIRFVALTYHISHLVY